MTKQAGEIVDEENKKINMDNLHNNTLNLGTWVDAPWRI